MSVFYGELGVFGPVDRPPWNLHRLLPGRGLHWQDVPRLVVAPQVGFCFGMAWLPLVLIIVTMEPMRRFELSTY
jgi:hypothetical protein